MKPVRSAIAAAALLLAGGACGSGDGARTAGPLATKARAYDENYAAIHMPFLGGSLKAELACPTCDEIVRYDSAGDSVFWSSNYLASQAFRWSVTRDPAALDNARRVVGFLDVAARITGRTGFLARYAGPVDDPRVFPGERCVPENDCHVIADGGEFDGLFWLGNTSRDQYTGWFFGMWLAYELIDDPAMNAIIRARADELADRVVADGYRIVDVDGEATTKGPDVLPHFALSWLLARARMTGDPADLRLYESQRTLQGPLISAFTITDFNRYVEYFGIHLSFLNLWNLVHLEDDPGWRGRYRDVFEQNVWRVVENDRQAGLDYMAMDAFDLDDPERIARVRQDLRDFQQPPERRITLPRDGVAYEEDPTWRVLKAIAGLIDEEYASRFVPVSREPFPVIYRCNDGFMWQRNPYFITCETEDDPAFEYAPMDYLVAYWMGRWRGFLDESD